MKHLLNKCKQLIYDHKKYLLILLFSFDLVIQLLLKSENIFAFSLNFIFGCTLFRLFMVKGAKLKYFWLSTSGILFFFSILNMNLGFYYLFTFIYPLLLIYAFFLPNPFLSLGFLLLYTPLFYRYERDVGIESFHGNMFGLFVNGFLYSLLIYLIRKLESKNRTLSKNQEETNALLSILPQPVFIHNEVEIFYTNKEGFKLIGAEKDSDLVDIYPLKYVHQHYHEMIKEKMETVLHNNVISRNNEFKLVNKDGKLYDMECSAVAFTYKNQPSIVTVVNDVTTKNRATEEIIQKSDKLHLVGQMAAGIAHEIRNPLTSIKGFLQLMRDEKEINHDYFEIMLTEIERINFIVNEFLILAKPHPANFSEKDLTLLIKNVLTLLNTQSIVHNVEIKTQFEDDIPPIKCDENQLKQVFINVIKNAVDAMPKGGMIQIEVKKDLISKVLIRVTDQGCGIPKERLKTLGEPFYTTKEKGTGLGLMVCYKIIENHLGSIMIDSELNKGTTVEITLPLMENSLYENETEINAS